MTGVTAFSGMIPASPGRMQMKLQSRAMAPPVSMVTGSRELWLEVPSMRRAMCGTASPIKEINGNRLFVGDGGAAFLAGGNGCEQVVDCRLFIDILFFHSGAQLPAFRNAVA